MQHCIYGVDRNPLAVELCKTALWIETVEPGKPLTFFDSHIQLGDSLVGILDPEIMADGIPGEAYKPLTGDDKANCRDLKKRNSQAGDSVQVSLFDEDSVFEVAVVTADLDAMPEETLDDIERKSAAWEEARQDEIRTREELRANLFVGAYFANKTRGINRNGTPHRRSQPPQDRNIPSAQALRLQPAPWPVSIGFFTGTWLLPRSCNAGDSMSCSAIHHGSASNYKSRSFSRRDRGRSLLPRTRQREIGSSGN